MAEASINALVITNQYNLEYYSGFRSLFWLSDTRPLIAVVRIDSPGISLILNASERRSEFLTRCPDVTPVFYTGFTDIALEAVVTVLEGLPQNAAIGFDYGRDMNGRGSVALISALQRYRLSDAADLIWQQRLIKSEHELQGKQAACKIATDAFFAGLPDLRLGMTEYAFGQNLKQRMIGLGADSVDWLPVRFGKNGRGYA
ncbi:aminopeptidase P family N-terminal domain-containing protein, partial [Mesorhizobium sp. M1A.F.Ca.IN.020.06.1.1]